MQNITANIGINTNGAKQGFSTLDIETEANTKQLMNKSIVQANINVSISTGSKSMELLFKTAIDGINDVLGENAIQTAYDNGIDVSPEATADRIVSLSTAFFSSYQKQHPELSIDEAAIQFAKVIGSGIEQGFAEASTILAGLNVLEGEIASNIDKTFNLVQDGLQAFVDRYTQA